ncbi:hypothetical protein SUGI_0479750 [Cryptomeria japonica]|nr:hypothetical protein SUGI_0479750 [Cryptomeria japonica]
MDKKLLIRVLVLVVIMAAISTQLTFPKGNSQDSNAEHRNSTVVYKDPHQPVEDRIEDLLSRITLAEKIGQMNPN